MRRHVCSAELSRLANTNQELIVPGRQQDTVGDMSKDQVSSALERQLQRSKGGAGSGGAGNGDSNGEVAAVEE
jgi:hypothetical protein